VWEVGGRFVDVALERGRRFDVMGDAVQSGGDGGAKAR